MANTTLSNLIDPEVLADMIDAKLPSAMLIGPFAKVDTTLVGQPGSDVTVPSYGYIGDAVVVAEGAAMPVRALSVSSKNYKIKKIAVGTGITDEAALSGYGNPTGQSSSQLTKSIASAIDADVATITQAGQVKKVNTGVISYTGIVESIDLFDEEVDEEKVMFISPKQKTTLRKDPEFKSKDSYGAEVVMRGEIGMIAGVRIVASKRIVATDGKYLNPIIKLNPADMTDDDTPAVTIYLKRETMVETSRDGETGTTNIYTNKHYVAAITDETKVVVAEFAAVETP